MHHLSRALAVSVAVRLVACSGGRTSPTANSTSTTPGALPIDGMSPVVDPHNQYSEAGAGKLSAAVNKALPRVQVPNLQSDDVYVIDGR